MEKETAVSFSQTKVGVPTFVMIALYGNPRPEYSGPRTSVSGGGFAAGTPRGLDKRRQCAYNVRLTAGGRLCHAQKGVVISEEPEREQALSLHCKNG